MKKSKTIVCDVDDTISTHINRDYKNATPHWPIINKLNKLYDEGWEIIYQTARGQLSFDGNLELIEKHRRPVLEEWLHRHGVKYHKLTFQKELGQYYIDDKAIRPDEFLEMTMEKLHGGSGAEVRREGNRVIKTQSNAADVYAWYMNAHQRAMPVPEMHSLIGDTITMDYIDNYHLFTKDCLSQVISLIHYMMTIETHVPFSTYIDRVKDHLHLCNHKKTREIITCLYEIEDEMNQYKSMCHGDLTLGNCIVDKDRKVFLIDPNPTPNVYTSWILDYAKLYQSMQFNYEQIFCDIFQEPLISYQDLVEETPEKIKHLLPLIQATHWVRMIKYREPKWHGLINDNINILLGEYYENRR